MKTSMGEGGKMELFLVYVEYLYILLHENVLQGSFVSTQAL